MSDKSADPVWKPTLITLAGMAASMAVGIGFWLLGRRLDMADAAPWVRWASLVVYAAIIWTSILATISLARRASGVRVLSAAVKRFNRRVIVAMSLYTLVLFVALLVWATARPTAVPVKLILALAPAAPLLAVIASIGLYLREEKDEFVRMVMNQSALAASGGALAIATVWGFCEMFRVAPHAPAWLIFPLWFLAFAVAQPVIRLRYR